MKQNRRIILENKLNNGIQSKTPIIKFYLTLLIISFLWSFFPHIADLWRMWMNSDEYSSGLLVPFISGYILYSRITKQKDNQIKVFWPAFIFLLLSQTLRVAGVLLMSAFLMRISLLFTVYSLLLLVLGYKICLKNYAVFLFMILMVPLPNSIHSLISPQLQHWATESAIFLLEVLGYKVQNEGNIIYINNTSVAVAEACNGLRMITAFFVTSGLIALIINKPVWQKATIFISTLPIAIICNTIRLVITSIAFTLISGDEWENLFHDFGGFAMMPLAILLVVLEIGFMNIITVNEGQKDIVDDHTIEFK